MCDPVLRAVFGLHNRLGLRQEIIRFLIALIITSDPMYYLHPGGRRYAVKMTLFAAVAL
jgi:hypothetical protein